LAVFRLLRHVLDSFK